jgi:acetoin utilization deacetylase AcuC-like enzyme
MFRIRRIQDGTNPEDASTLAQVQQILASQFPAVDPETVASLPRKLTDPASALFRPRLFVAEGRGGVRGFALLFHAPDLQFCYLDFISAVKGGTGGGIGGALYQRVRDEALALGGSGIFLESLPDDPALCRDPAIVKQNAARLRFYERYGARPIANTAYETPVRPGDDCPPYLVFDDLGQHRPLGRRQARLIVRAILERKYAQLCPPAYVDRVVASFDDDPVELRSPRYVPGVRPTADPERGAPVQPGRRIGLVVNDRHSIHHVRERGYVEAPVRIDSILRELGRVDLFDAIDPRRFSEAHITAVHDADYVAYLRRVCNGLDEKVTVYPYVFPIRNVARPPKDLAIRAGYYCIDTFTPLSRNAYLAARRAVDCGLTAAQMVLEAYPFAYALVRPPGHHAERRSFGGFCYFNTAAIAAHYLRDSGRVAILDIDYHHGNGQQDIFWRRADVLTISIHGDPSFAYPYFSGFEDERGEDDGVGYNLNIPLPETADGERYRRALRRALRAVEDFAPDYLVIALGLDPAKGDPTGSWSLTAADFEENGRLIGALGTPAVIVQEGGYRTASLGINARRFLIGLWKGKYMTGDAADLAGGREHPEWKPQGRGQRKTETTATTKERTERTGNGASTPDQSSRTPEA